MEIRDNGRLISAETIAKMYGTRRSNVEKRFTRPINMRELADSVEEQNGGMRKVDHGTRMNKQIRKAVRPRHIGMKPNGISDASLKLIKIAHRHPRDLDPELFTKLSLPEESMNSMNDNERSDDGATLASEGADDEASDLKTKARIVGSQAVVDVSDAGAINAASISAMKRALRRPKAAFLQ